METPEQAETDMEHQGGRARPAGAGDGASRPVPIGTPTPAHEPGTRAGRVGSRAGRVGSAVQRRGQRAARAARVGGAVALVSGAALTASGLGLASADVVGVQPVAAGAAYPVPLPDGCPDGSGAFVGLSFEADGIVATSLWGLSLDAGQTVTMRWDGLAPACATAEGQPAAGVSLAAYDLPGPAFDPAVDQPLLPGWVSCGGNGPACTTNGAGGGSLTVVTPAADTSCRWQLDAVHGAPLAVVGPSGSWFSAVLRGDTGPTMLVDAATHEVVPCAPQTTPVPTTAAPVDTSAVPTTAPPTTQPPTTQPPTTDTAAGVTPSSVTPSSALAGQVTAPSATAATAAAASPVAVSPSARGTLPFTGSDPTTPAAGLLLVGLGGALLLAGRRAAGRPEDTVANS